MTRRTDQQILAEGEARYDTLLAADAQQRKPLYGVMGGRSWVYGPACKEACETFVRLAKSRTASLSVQAWNVLGPLLFACFDLDPVAEAIYVAMETDIRGQGPSRKFRTDAAWDSRDDELCEWERDEYRTMARAALGMLLGERKSSP